MFATDVLEAIVTGLRAEVTSLDPESLAGPDASRVVLLCCEIERLAMGARTLCLQRVDQTRVFRDEGFVNTGTWLSAKSGTSIHEATQVVKAARQLKQLPLVEKALRNGELSHAQTRKVLTAAAVAPGQEVMLLDTAKTASFKELRQACSTALGFRSTSHENTTYEQVHRRRYFRHWKGDDGLVHGAFGLPPDQAAPLLALQQTYADEAFKHAWRQRKAEPFVAHQADGLAALAVDRAGRDSNVQKTVVIRVDYAALVRGYRKSGEVCEVGGLGEIPVALARALSQDSFLKVLVMRDGNVAHVAHKGRTIPAKVRSALAERDQCCVVPHCGADRWLEIDHYRIPFAEGGPAELWNLARLCSFHHRLKTLHGFRLAGGPGAWKWLPPIETTMLDEAV